MVSENPTYSEPEASLTWMMGLDVLVSALGNGSSPVGGLLIKIGG